MRPAIFVVFSTLCANFVFADSLGPQDTNTVQVGGVTYSLGPATSSNSAPVVIASDQAPIPVTGSFSAGGDGGLLYVIPIGSDGGLALVQSVIAAADGGTLYVAIAGAISLVVGDGGALAVTQGGPFVVAVGDGGVLSVSIGAPVVVGDGGALAVQPTFVFPEATDAGLAQVNVENFPATQAVTQGGPFVVAVGDGGVLSVSIGAPVVVGDGGALAVQPTFVFPEATDAGLAQVNVENFPATQAVTQGGPFVVAVGDGGVLSVNIGTISDGGALAITGSITSTPGPVTTQDGGALQVITIAPVVIGDGGVLSVSIGAPVVIGDGGALAIQPTFVFPEAADAGLAQVNVENFPVTQPVSGTVAATQSGTWNVGTISDGGQLLIGGQGLAGMPNGGVLSVQGVTNGVGLNVVNEGGSVTIADGGGLSVNATQVGPWNVGTISDGGPIATSQSGTWNVGTISDGGPIATSQSGTWNVGTISDGGPIATSQSGTWNVGIISDGGGLSVNATQVGPWNVGTISDGGVLLVAIGAPVVVGDGGALQVNLTSLTDGGYPQVQPVQPADFSLNATIGSLNAVSTVNCNGLSTMVLEVESTFSGTVSFLATADGLAFGSIQCIDGLAGFVTGTVKSTTVPGIFTCNVGGLK